MEDSIYFCHLESFFSIFICCKIFRTLCIIVFLLSKKMREIKLHIIFMS